MGFRVWHLSPKGERIQSCVSANSEEEAIERTARAFPKNEIVYCHDAKDGSGSSMAKHFFKQECLRRKNA